MGDLERRVLEGAYDLHIHFGPDVMPRKGTEMEIARRSLDAGMRGFGIKSHFTPTMERARLVNDQFPGLHAVGGVVLNRSVGGLNPMAVEVAGRLGGRIVWFPTVDAAHDVPRLKEDIPQFVELQVRLEERGMLRSAVPLLDGSGELVEPVYHVLEIAREHDMAVATGHSSPREGLALVKAAHEMGLRKIVVTHADWKATNYSLEAQAMAIADGALIEHCYMTPSIPYEEIGAQMRALGPEHFYLSTDLGAVQVPGGKKGGFLMSGSAPYPDEGMAAFVGILHGCGFSEGELRRMVVDNPAVIAE
ncbi:cytosolic protein [bacterium 1xD42-67]|nr:cytosolic protein [bacterium 1xD42-67]